MARGWESKSVEAQQEASSRADQGAGLTPEERAVWKRRQSLESSRRRVLREIETTPSPARREALVQALRELDEELEAPA